MTTKDPSICPHGLTYLNCTAPECVQELSDAEDAATCQHGFFVGCPVCNAIPAKPVDLTIESCVELAAKHGVLGKVIDDALCDTCRVPRGTRYLAQPDTDKFNSLCVAIDQQTAKLQDSVNYYQSANTGLLESDRKLREENAQLKFCLTTCENTDLELKNELSGLQEMVAKKDEALAEITPIAEKYEAAYAFNVEAMTGCDFARSKRARKALALTSPAAALEAVIKDRVAIAKEDVCAIYAADKIKLLGQVEQLSASNARMAEELKLLILQDFDSEDAPDCPEGASEIVLWVIQQYQSRIQDIVFDTYDPAWLEADRAEAGRKAQVSLLRSMIADLDDSSYGADDLQKIIDRIELKQKPHNPNDCQCGGGDCSNCPR